jgi:FixJ family two-component response regulator
MMARVRRPRLPVIFMSGYPGLIKEGRIDEPVFEKPFDLSSLVEAIRARLHSEPDAPRRPDRRA